MRNRLFAYAKTKAQIILGGCTARFVADLVGNPEDRFSHNEAHIKYFQLFCHKIQSLFAP